MSRCIGSLVGACGLWDRNDYANPIGERSHHMGAPFGLLVQALGRPVVEYVWFQCWAGNARLAPSGT